MDILILYAGTECPYLLIAKHCRRQWRGKAAEAASGGNPVGGFLMRNKRSARWAVAMIEHAEQGRICYAP